MKRQLLRLQRYALEFYIRGLLLPKYIQDVRVAENLESLEPDTPIVFCVLRNGCEYIHEFIQYHRSIGINSFVFMVNNSEDDVEKLILEYSGTTVLRSSAPYERFENTMKRYLVDRFGTNKWCLLLDIDEFFIFPECEATSINILINYLNQREFTAVVTQMLDMFPIQSLKNQATQESSFIDSHVYYDLTNIEKSNYELSLKLTNKYPEAIANSQIAFHRNGIRHSIFGSSNGLTKVSFFKNVRKLKSFVLWHHTLNANIADMSCGLLHYPFLSSFSEKVKDAVVTGRYGKTTTKEYLQYNDQLSETGDVCLYTPTATRFECSTELYNNGFLFSSNYPAVNK